jgi:trimethyllysine dioxygenase
MSGERGILNWLNLTHQYGFSFVKGLPPNLQATKELIEKLSYIRATIYGQFWDLTPNMEVKDLAYSNIELQVHNDGCYFTDPPGIQCFHLLEHNGEGGQTVLVDGFQVAYQLKKKDPESFHFLTETKIPYHFIDDTHYLYQEHTIIGINENSDVNRITFNNEDRAPLNFSLEKMKKFYKAIYLFMKLLRSPTNIYQFSLKPGTLLIINNQRVLHGRRAFTGHRHLCGAYLNKEDFISRTKIAIKNVIENK